MSTRRFEMIEGSSSKFWEVALEGSAFTVTFGRIGTPGTSKTTTCSSGEAAQKEVDKLIREKTKKGYQEPGSEMENWRPPVHYSTFEHVERFLNYKVVAFNPDADGTREGGGRRELPSLRELDKLVYALGISYDDADEDFNKRLEALLADPRLGELRALLIGSWFSECCEEPPTALIERLIAKAPVMTSLQGLFLGDIIQEECEISWLHQGDCAPLLHALPRLETFVVRGGDGLRFKDLRHEGLRSLTVQTGGLDGETLRDITHAHLPNLRQLTLWLGVEDYGASFALSDLAPLWSGSRFPNLEHLGLQNTEMADEMAIALASSPLLARLKGLDLSMGTLSDVGGKALLDSPHLLALKHLNLRHHYLSAGVAGNFRALGIHVNVSEGQDMEDDRYVEISE